jgi:hypothetical protein
MTIEYRSNRSEVAAAYWYTWRHSWRMRILQVVIAAAVFLWTSSFLRSPDRPFRSTVFPAALWTAAVLALLPLYPQLRFKSQLRRLTIDENGIHTTIGALRGDIPWARVVSIATVRDRTYVIGTNLNCFIIPERAFSTAEQRIEFIRSAETWWRGAIGPGTA